MSVGNTHLGKLCFKREFVFQGEFVFYYVHTNRGSVGAIAYSIVCIFSKILSCLKCANIWKYRVLNHIFYGVFDIIEKGEIVGFVRC